MLTCGKRSKFALRVYLGPRSFCFWRAFVEERFVLFVEVFVLFTFAFAGVVVVVRERWFFFNASCVFDLGEDDLISFDAPRELVTFFPVEVLEDVVRDFDEEVLRVIVLLNFSLEGVHFQSTIYE